MKKIFRTLLVLMVISFIVPQIALASWWNPFSWNIWQNIWNSIFHKQAAVECTTAKDCQDIHKNCYYSCSSNKCVQIETFVALKPYPDCSSAVSCTPNWQCGWGPCIIPPCAPGSSQTPACMYGNQSQIAVDINNCGLPSSNANIACPALARVCDQSSSGLPVGGTGTAGVGTDDLSQTALKLASGWLDQYKSPATALENRLTNYKINSIGLGSFDEQNNCWKLGIDYSIETAVNPDKTRRWAAGSGGPTGVGNWIDKGDQFVIEKNGNIYTIINVGTANMGGCNIPIVNTDSFSLNIGEQAAGSPAGGCNLLPYTGKVPFEQLPDYNDTLQDVRAGMVCKATIGPSLPVFTFHFIGLEDNTFSKVEITEGASAKIIQTITPTSFPLDPIYYSPTKAQDGVSFEDYNFDGYKDFSVLSMCGATGNCNSDYYLYDPATNQFVHNSFLSGLMSAGIDESKKQITTSYNSSAFDGGSTIYQYQDGKYVLTHEEVTALDRNANISTFKESDLINGKMELTISTSTNASGTTTLTDNEYGFEMTFPKDWNGSSVINSTWQGWKTDGSGKIGDYNGPEIIFRNPNWTEQKHWQDIEIMVFTPDVWKLIQDETVGVSAAPIGPAEVGSNSKYIFATPPRWYGFVDVVGGWQEAVDIVKTFKAF